MREGKRFGQEYFVRRSPQKETSSSERAMVTCLPLLEPILPTSRSDVARSARVGVLYAVVRFELVE